MAKIDHMTCSQGNYLMASSAYNSVMDVGYEMKFQQESKGNNYNHYYNPDTRVQNETGLSQISSLPLESFSQVSNRNHGLKYLGDFDTAKVKDFDANYSTPNNKFHNCSVIRNLDYPDQVHTDKHVHTPPRILNLDENSYHTEYEESMEDEMSDVDEEIMEKEECLSKGDSFEKQNATQQLLDFVKMVDKDIQKFFGSKKDDESCDVYEDKWTSGKSGRELYYRDLLRIAQGFEAGEEPKSGKKTKNETVQDNGNKKEIPNKKEITYTGKMNEKMGLGPLGELFEFGLKEFLTKEQLTLLIDKISGKHNCKKNKTDLERYSIAIPWQQKKLPKSFWSQPGQEHHSQNGTVKKGTHGLLASNTPDFSDLLESWRGDHSHQNH